MQYRYPFLKSLCLFYFVQLRNEVKDMYMLNRESRVVSGKVCVNGKAGRMRMQFSLFS